MMTDSGNIKDHTHLGGRLGVFGFSQAKIIWSNIRHKCSGNNWYIRLLNVKYWNSVLVFKLTALFCLLFQKKYPGSSTLLKRTELVGIVFSVVKVITNVFSAATKTFLMARQ